MLIIAIKFYDSTRFPPPHDPRNPPVPCCTLTPSIILPRGHKARNERCTTTTRHFSLAFRSCPGSPRYRQGRVHSQIQQLVSNKPGCCCCCCKLHTIAHSLHTVHSPPGRAGLANRLSSSKRPELMPMPRRQTSANTWRLT